MISAAAIKRALWANPLFVEAYIWIIEKKRFLSEARTRFQKEGQGRGSYADYVDAFRRHRVTFSEYMYSYEYWHLNEGERDAFISTSEMQCIYRKLGSRAVRNLFTEKPRFLQAFRDFVSRRWAVAREMSEPEFVAFLSSCDCILKPLDGTRGEGIRKICEGDAVDLHALYRTCVEQNLLVEECVQACEEISSFHPSSLNTIRVVTISNGERCEVFGALLRMGAHGSVIDNTHAGGVYAPINIETGIVDVEAIDSQNHHYALHPDTGKPIKGFVIPHWDRIVACCKSACRVVPDIHFAGWDVCILPNGKIEIIEGNHAPDFDGGMQAPLKIGVKKKLQDTVIRIMGVDPLPYISVWHNSIS